MNNSKIALDEISLYLDKQVDKTEHLRERESVLIRIIEAINRVKESQDWSTLKSLVFDGRIESLEKQMDTESFNENINAPELYRLQGKIFEARKYDLDKLLESYRLELSSIKRITTQPTER